MFSAVEQWMRFLIHCTDAPPAALSLSQRHEPLQATPPPPVSDPFKTAPGVHPLRSLHKPCSALEESPLLIQVVKTFLAA